MKKLCTILGLAGMVAVPNLFASYDGTIKLTAGNYENGNGGEFTATTSGLGTFETFCVEYQEEFYLGDTYDYNMNAGAVAGGVNLGTLHTDPHTGLPMDDISIGTAYLYSQFRNGGIVISSVVQAGEFQNAIWYLENEITYSQMLSLNGVNGLVYYSLAKSGTSTTDTTVFNDSNGAYGVIVLNLFNGPGDTQVTSPNGQTYYLNQDQLAIVPEPTTVIAAALLLLPLGASTLRILRRNRTA